MAKAKTTAVPVTLNVPMDKFIKNFAQHLQYMLSDDFGVNISTKKILERAGEKITPLVTKHVLAVLKEMAADIDVDELSYDVDFEKIFAAEIDAAAAKQEAEENKLMANRDVTIRVSVKGKDREATAQKLADLGFKVD
jgi:uncharacterized radical SAM superfamily Fe-S cluster-containing enzyme